MIIVIINGMSIVCVQMYVIDVCYCVDGLRIVLGMVLGLRLRVGMYYRIYDLIL